MPSLFGFSLVLMDYEIRNYIMIMDFDIHNTVIFTLLWIM